LQGAGGETKTAIAMSLLHVTAEVARQPLSAHNGRLRETLAALDREEHRSRNQVIFFHHAQHKPPPSLTALRLCMGLLHLPEGKRITNRDFEIALIGQPCQRLQGDICPTTARHRTYPTRLHLFLFLWF
jgi:type II secretory pathway predicted ATPase ExeA